MIKKLIVLSCCAFIALNAYAQPNTVTVSGNFTNNATKDINPPGWNYITARITLSAPSDTQYVKIAGAAIPASGLYFNMEYNHPIDYLIDVSHLSGTMTAEFYNPNDNSKCVWRFYKYYMSANLVEGDSTICTQKDNIILMNKRS